MLALGPAGLAASRARPEQDSRASTATHLPAQKTVTAPSQVHSLSLTKLTSTSPNSSITLTTYTTTRHPHEPPPPM